MKTPIIFIASALFFSITTSSYSQYIWTQKNDFAGPGRYSGVAFTIGNNAYYGTGADFSISTSTIYTDFWEYDTMSDSWTQKADLPSPQRYGAVGFSIGNLGYLGTGFATLNGTPLNSFYQFDPIINTWTAIAPLPGPGRYTGIGLATASMGYAGFGYAPVQKDFYQYDPLTQQWDTTPAFPGIERQSLVGFAIGDALYLGCGSPGLSGSDFWKFDTQTQQWSQLASYPHAMYGGVGFAWQGMGFVGLGRTAAQHFNDIHKFDPFANSWNAITSLPADGRDAASAFVAGNHAYVIGGRTSSNDFVNEVWSLDLATAIASAEPNKTKLTLQPRNGNLFIDFTSEVRQNFMLSFLDITGKVIYQKLITHGYQQEVTIPANQYVLYRLDDQKSIVKSGKVIVVG